MRRHGGNKDILHDAVARLFRDQGYDVVETHELSGGVPDMAVFRGELGFLVEVKTKANIYPSRHNADGLNEKQQSFHERHKSRIWIVASLEEAWRVIDRYRLVSEQEAPA
jgi:hypothetical protein